MKRNVALLAICQALMMTSLSLIGTTSALVGFALTDVKALATLPHALQFAGMMAVTYPASLLMGRIGRRPGFLIGAVIAIVGGGIATAAILRGSFELFCLGSFVIGGSNAFGQYYRFAAADVSTAAFRSRAISLVLSGGVVAAFAGPNLAGLTQDLIQSALFAGSYLCIVGLYLATCGVLALVRIPHERHEGASAEGRSLAAIARQPDYVTALICAIVAYGVMNLLMTATPLAMHARGLDFGYIVQVIQIHILGMYAPAFFTGHLIRRFGLLPVMQVGTVLLAVAAVINLVGDTIVHFWISLLVLGLGWNFMFTGATTMITETYAAAEKARAQGLNDLILFSCVATTALLSGALHHVFGWTVLNIAVLPPIALAAVLLLFRHHRRTRTAA